MFCHNLEQKRLYMRGDNNVRLSSTQDWKVPGAQLMVQLVLQMVVQLVVWLVIRLLELYADNR